MPTLCPLDRVELNGPVWLNSLEVKDKVIPLVMEDDGNLEPRVFLNGIYPSIQSFITGRLYFYFCGKNTVTYTLKERTKHHRAQLPLNSFKLSYLA